MPSHRRLGELLLRSGALESHDLSLALAEQEAGTGERLGRLLVRLGAIDEVTLATTLAQQWGLPVVDPDRECPDGGALHRLPREMAVQLQALPLRREGRRLVVAVAEPPTRELRRVLMRCTGGGVDFVLAPVNVLADMIERWYSQPVLREPEAPTGASREAMRQVSREDTRAGPERWAGAAFHVTPEDPTAHIGLGPVPNTKPRAVPSTPYSGSGSASAPSSAQTAARGDRVVAWLLSSARRVGATTVRLEGDPAGGCVCYLTGGTQRHGINLPVAAGKTLIRRVLLAAGLDPARSSPQAGRFRGHSRALMLDVEVTAAPTPAGYTAVLRLDIAQPSPGR